jgi:hypothetical protein
MAGWADRDRPPRRSPAGYAGIDWHRPVVRRRQKTREFEAYPGRGRRRERMASPTVCSHAAMGPGTAGPASRS